MRRNSSVWIMWLVMALSGCSARPQQRVFVDLARLVGTESIPNVKVIPSPSSTPLFPATTLSLPPLPATTFKLSSDKQRIAQVQAVVNTNRRQAFRDIAQKLRDA